MTGPIRKMVVMMLLAAVAGGVGWAQRRNHRYKPGELAQVATETVILDEVGISPEKFKGPSGAFLLVIMNRRGDHLEHFSLTLDQDGAPELYSFDTTAERWQGAIMVDLEPGHYRLRLTNSSELSVAMHIK